MLGFSKTAFLFDMGCVYIDTGWMILLGKLSTYDFKDLPVESTIYFCIFQCFEEKIVDPTYNF
jgi:hypothetical protein